MERTTPRKKYTNVRFMMWDIMVKQWECGRMCKGIRVGLWDERVKESGNIRV